MEESNFNKKGILAVNNDPSAEKHGEIFPFLEGVLEYGALSREKHFKGRAKRFFDSRFE